MNTVTSTSAAAAQSRPNAPIGEWPMRPTFTMPIGVITNSDPDQHQFLITTEHYSRTLLPDTPITIWSYHEGSDSLSRVRGNITRIDKFVATFTIVDKQVDHSWPQHPKPILQGACVYEATPGTYRPQGFPITNDKDLHLLHELLNNDTYPPNNNPSPMGFTWIPQEFAAGLDRPPAAAP